MTDDNRRIEFKVISSTAIEHFNESVTAALNDGWERHGAEARMCVNVNGYPWYYITLTKGNM